jgi:hypothetical protein
MLARKAGADPEAIPAWIAEGRRRRAAARQPPFSGSLHGGGAALHKCTLTAFQPHPVSRTPAPASGRSLPALPCAVPGLIDLIDLLSLLSGRQLSSPQLRPR